MFIDLTERIVIVTTKGDSLKLIIACCTHAVNYN